MNVDQIKSQLLRNRKALAKLHDHLYVYQMSKRNYQDCGLLDGEYYCHNQVKHAKEEITKLVILQQALKADLRKELSYARSVRRMSLVVMGK